MARQSETIPPSALKEYTFTIENGSEIDTEELQRKLLAAGYTRTDQVEGAAQFAVRGSIIDIFPVQDKQPVRIELWGDEVDTMAYFDTEIEDKMFSDWRFYHFHLSDPDIRHPDDERFLERSDYLLIAYIDPSDDDTIYFLQIIPHKRANWTKEELVRDLADNWPDLVKRNVFEGSLTAKISDRDRKQLRNNNINTPVDLGDERVIIGLGSGICGDGSSFEVRHKCMRFENEAQIIAMRIETDVDTIGELIHGKLQNEQKVFSLKLLDLPNTQTAIFRVSDTPVYLGVTLKKYVVADSREQVMCALN